MIEVIATTIEDVIDANEYGADRIELCSSMDADGLTPSIGLIKEACRISDIPVNVMVRNHNNGFVYSEIDQKIMLDEIEYIKETKANGIVIGMLNDLGDIDESFLKTVHEISGALDIVFHKAFDQIKNYDSALKTLSNYKNVKTILTSGGQGPATNHLEVLTELSKQADQYGMTIMPGGGLKFDGVNDFKHEFKALHFGTGVRVDGTFSKPLSGKRMTRLKNIWK